MALNVGELEATLRLKDELTAQLAKANAMLVEFGTQATTQSTKASSGFSGLGLQLKSLASALGVTFSVGALVGFGRNLLQTADALVKVADQTNLTIEEVQRLQYITGQTGVAFASAVGAIQNLQFRIGSDNTGTIAAVKALGLNLSELKGLGTFELFVTLASAIGKIEDPINRAIVAEAAFGKAWKELLPVIRADIQGLAVEAPVMSEKAAQALDDVGDAFARLWGQIKAGAGNFLAFAKDVNWGDAAMARLNGTLDVLNGIGPKVHGTVGSLGEQFKATAGQAEALTMSERELKRVMEELDKPVKKSIDAWEKNTEAIKNLRMQLSGEALQADVSNLEQAFADLVQMGTPTPAMLERTADAALVLQDAGGRLTPTLAAVVEEYAKLRMVMPGLSADFSAMGQQVGLNLTPLKSIIDEAAFFAAQAEVAWVPATEEVTEATKETAQAVQGLGVVATISYGDLISGASAAASAVRRSEAEISAAMQAISDAYRNAGIIQHITGPSWMASGVPAFASGVTNFGGGAAIVGERGPELVTLPRGSNVTPNGAVSSVSVSVDARGSFFDTPSGQARFARIVSDAIDQKLRARGGAVGRA